jgi:hypothetical protein
MESQFLFLFRGGDPARAGFSPHSALQQWGSWVAELRGSGRFVHGEPLRGDEGRVLAPEGRASQGCVGSAGDAVSGYLAVRAESIDAAQSLAAGCPVLLHGGTVEIRPMFVVNGKA